MTVKELKEALANIPDNANVYASDWEKHCLVREVMFNKNTGDITLRLWKTDKETFEAERKQAEWDQKNTEMILNDKKKKTSYSYPY